MKPIQLFLAVLLTTTASTPAQDSTARSEPPGMVEIEAYFVRASPETISAAINSSGATAGIFSPEQFAIILQALKERGATIFGNPRAVTMNGQRGSSSAVKDIPFPSEYETDPTSGKKHPISFDRKNVGITLDVEPIIGPGDRIDVVTEPKVTNFLGFIDFSDPSPPKDSSATSLLKSPLKEGGVWQPVFSEFRVSSRLILYSGQTTIMGGLAEEVSSQAALEKGAIKSPDAGRLIYVFVTARTIKGS